MSEHDNPLGDFLRARRELVRPDEVGLTASGLRRVRGLRREEVALLAGISADYYLRLEQGRDRRPSTQVLDALARVLRLDEATAAYLHSLCADKPRRSGRGARREAVPVGLAKLVNALPMPVFVEGRYLDVLASNALAAALSPRLVAGRNRLRDVFLDPAERDQFPDWEIATQYLVAGFRQSVGLDTDDPRFVELVGELSLVSPRFRELWARHEVHTREGAVVRLVHPQLGALTLNREKLTVTGSAGLMLVIYHADVGSADAEKLGLLAAIAEATAPRA